MNITLNDIRRHSPCKGGWEKLLAGLGKTKADDEPLSFATILEINGLNDALWCLRALPREYESQVRLLACDFAERSLECVPEDEDGPREAIETVRRFAHGEATESELSSALESARDAVWADASASTVGYVWEAVWYAARADAADAARSSEWAAWDAAWSFSRHTTASERDASRDAERAAQTQILKKWIEENQL